MKQLVYRGVCALLFLGVVTGCGGTKESDVDDGQGTETPATGKVIGYSKMNSNNPFFEVIAKNIQSEAATHGYSVKIVSAEADVAKQMDQIRDFVVSKVDAIVLNPADSEAIGAAIAEANAAGIPVFTCDLECTADGVTIAGHIATDNYQGGRLAGEAMIEALGENGGEIAILTHDPAASCVKRVAGFDDVINAHNEGRESGRITVVKRLPCDGQRDPGFKATQDIITAHSDLAGIFAINDPGALGALAALEKAGKAAQVKIIGFDGQPDGKQAIKEGKIYADPIQFPDRMGQEIVRMISEYFAGELMDAERLIPAELYRQEDGQNDPTLN